MGTDFVIFQITAQSQQSHRMGEAKLGQSGHPVWKAGAVTNQGISKTSNKDNEVDLGTFYVTTDSVSSQYLCRQLWTYCTYVEEQTTRVRIPPGHKKGGKNIAMLLLICIVCK
jgi:hypothetical protein